MTSDGSSQFPKPIPFPLRSKAFLSVLLLVVVFLAHGGSLHGAFLLDDLGAIVDNESIHTLTLSSLQTVLWGGKFTTVAGRPLLNLTLAINYAWGGVHPEGYHVFNYVVHAASAFVLFSFLRRVLAQFSETGRAAVSLALTISLVWCIHPLTINAVSYVCQRAESLASCFYLIVLWAFVKGIQTSRRRWFALSILAAWAGSFTKEIIATVPVTVLALDVLVVTRDWRTALRRHWGVYLGLLSSWIPLGACMWWSKSRAGTVGFGMGVTLQEHLQTQVWAIARYLRLAVWPNPLTFDYGDHFVVSDFGQVLSASVVVLFWGVLVVWLLVRRSPWAFPGVVLCLLLSPTSVIPIATQTVAEHRMYLASACVIASLVLIGYLSLARLPRFSSASWSSQVTISCALIAPVAATLFLSTVRHTRVLLSAESVWEDTVQKHPQNQRAVYSLALAKSRANREVDIVRRLCDQAIEMPGIYDVSAYALRGRLFAQQGEFEKAFDDFSQAIRLRPKAVEYYHQRALALLSLERYDEAIHDIDKAKAVDPANINTDLVRGTAHTKRGELALALECFERFLTRNPSHVTARRQRASLYARLNRWQDAMREIRRLEDEGHRVDAKLVEQVKQNLASQIP